MLRLQAIADFLNSKTHGDLASLFNADMEVQVNVALDNGEAIEKEYKGHKYPAYVWPDGQTGSPLRIPRNASKEPEYTDCEISFDMNVHVEAVGMTGWDWRNKLSRWVVFDFDAITGHSSQHTKKLSKDELKEIETKLAQIPYVTIRKSTGGAGLHIYIFLEPVPTETHTEHAAVARSIIGMLASEVDLPLTAQVDVCGGNMWVWHRKMKDVGLHLVKQGTELAKVPLNWKEHISVVRGKSQRAMPSFISEQQRQSFEQLCGRRSLTKLDEGHKALLEYLQAKEYAWYWDADYNMLVTHTYALKMAFKDLRLKGVYDTLAEGSDQYDINCYAFPASNGAWTLRRFTRGVAESPSWIQDGTGWTKCTFNVEPTFETVAKAHGAKEHPKGGYVFATIAAAQEALSSLDVKIAVPDNYTERDVHVKEQKNGKLAVTMKAMDRDVGMNFSDWLVDKGNLCKVVEPIRATNVEHDDKNFDEILRHTVSEDGVSLDWLINVNGQWHAEPLSHVREAMSYLGLNPSEVKDALGASVFKPWMEVNIPFGVEYPGDRRWNRQAANFAVAPALDVEELHYPTWTKLIMHLGTGLDDAVKSNLWCQQHGINTGGEYINLWIAAMFKHPLEPLPYLFFFSKAQNTGKSTLSEALQRLMTKGYVRADKALRSKGDFNGELVGSVLCAVEEMNINEFPGAYDRIKDWVTSRSILIHSKGQTPYMIQNTTHWIQTANSYEYCPVFPGDTRIIAVRVPLIAPEDRMPGTQFTELLDQEASHFLAHCLKLDIPESDDRLRIPVLHTREKAMIEAFNQNPIEQFIEQRIRRVEGHAHLSSGIYELYRIWCKERDIAEVSQIAFSKVLAAHFDKGRRTTNSRTYYINIVIVPADDPFFTLPPAGKAMHTDGQMILSCEEATYVE